jgi:Na+-driven multidrug efflux pump
MFMLTINTLPEHLKGFQKGIIKSLGLQHLSVIAHLIGNFGINLSLMYYLCKVREVGPVGILISKVVMEVFLVISPIFQFYIIESADWNQIIRKSMQL